MYSFKLMTDFYFINEQNTCIFFFQMQLNNPIASNTTFQEIDCNTYENVTLKPTHTIFAIPDNLWFVPKLSAV